MIKAHPYAWLSNFEINLLDKDDRLIYFSNITPTQLNAYLKENRNTTYESFLERWNNVVDFISFQLNYADYVHAVADALGHVTSNTVPNYEKFVAEIIMPYIKDYLESNDTVRPIIFSRFINEHPTGFVDNLIKILLSNCPYVDNITLDRIDGALTPKSDINILVDTIKYKYIPNFIRSKLNDPRIERYIWTALSKVPRDRVFEIIDDMYNIIPASNTKLRDYLAQITF